MERDELNISDSQHSQYQKEYFANRIKKTMIPVSTPYVQRHVQEMVRFGGIVPGERVLDVGCGMGRYTFLLAERGIQVEGLELSPFLTDRLREYDAGRYNIPVHNVDLFRPPPEMRERFDAVVGFFMLHHLLNLQQAFDAIQFLLKPGGRMVFVEPNPLNCLYYVQIFFTPGMRWKAERGMVLLRPGTLMAALESVGLRNFEFSRFGFFPPILANKAWGSRLEARLEMFPLWKPFLPFQLIKAQK